MNSIYARYNIFFAAFISKAGNALLPVVLLLLCVTGSLKAQTSISGVINAYRKVSYIDPTKTHLGVPGAAPAFAAGDKVLVIQMKGASINTTNTSSYGTVTNMNSVGYYEFNNVASASTDSVILAGPLCRPYSVNDSVQIIRVPVYSGNVTVSGTLSCDAFNGSTGGVLVLEVGGTLNLQANIDVSNLGYRGGNVFGSSFLCNSTSYYSAQGGFAQDGKKGEGIAPYVFAQECGMGKLANGGGGSGSANTGGGGGANYAAGGMGGLEYSGCIAPITNQSYGGDAIAPVPERVFMGGGGGGPQHDNGNFVVNGGNGGGIIIIKAAAITGNANAIRSNGQSITSVIADEGTSGGGAGGSIYLLCNTYNTALTVEAKGGDGGSNNNVLFATFCHGPGGGGSGGLVWLSTAATPAGVTTTLNGGAAGLVYNPSSPCYNTSNGATAGGNGGVLYNLVDASYNPLGLNDTLICTPTASMTLNIGSGYNGVLWSTGATTNSINVTGPGIYSVQATTPLGCILRDTSVVRVDSMTLGNDTVICVGASIALEPRPTGNFSSYQWSTGATTASISTDTGGRYAVTVVTLAGCTFSDTIKVAIDTIPRLRDTVLCTDHFAVVLAMPTGYQQYLWNTGATTSSITVAQPGTYFVQLLTSHNCALIDTALVIRDAIDIGPDTLLCISQTPYYLVPQPAGNITSYLWNDGSSNDSLSVTRTGTYWVTAHTIYDCNITDSVHVVVDSTPYLHTVFADSIICEGNQAAAMAVLQQQGLDSLVWDFGDGTPGVYDNNPALHSYDTAGVYIVTVSAKYRVCDDLSVQDTVVVHTYPSIDLGPDTSLCLYGQPLLIGDLNNAGNPDVRYRWNTGDSTAAILIRHHGLYWATISEYGCSTTDSVQVFKDCYLDIPNAFTPNGDGTNDYFFPRQLLSRSVSAFSMKVFSRWGQVVFETNSTNGRGWDGRFNGKDQPEGVYVYLIEAAFVNGAGEKYQGNVSLLR